jgi:hypothetical protein
MPQHLPTLFRTTTRPNEALPHGWPLAGKAINGYCPHLYSPLLIDVARGVAVGNYELGIWEETGDWSPEA